MICMWNSLTLHSHNDDFKFPPDIQRRSCGEELLFNLHSGNISTVHNVVFYLHLPQFPFFLPLLNRPCLAHFSAVYEKCTMNKWNKENKKGPGEVSLPKNWAQANNKRRLSWAASAININVVSAIAFDYVDWHVVSGPATRRESSVLPANGVVPSDKLNQGQPVFGPVILTDRRRRFLPMDIDIMKRAHEAFERRTLFMRPRLRAWPRSASLNIGCLSDIMMNKRS